MEAYKVNWYNNNIVLVFSYITLHWRQFPIIKKTEKLNNKETVEQKILR